MLYTALITFCSVGHGPIHCYDKQFDFDGLLACTILSQRAAGDYVKKNAPGYKVKRIRCKPSAIAERLRRRYE